MIDLTFPAGSRAPSTSARALVGRTIGNAAGQICRLAAVAGMVLACVTVAPAQLQPPATIPTNPNVLNGGCWVELRPFSNLRYGNFNYCRTSLRFRPGRLDCAQFLDQACWLLLPGATQWTLTRANQSRALIPCPSGPEPPVCPRLGP